MKITKEVTVEAEVEMDVTFADLVAELSATADNTRAMLSGFSQFLRFTEVLPDDLLSTLNEKQRTIIVDSLSQQLSRIAAIKVQPTPEPITSTAKALA